MERRAFIAGVTFSLGFLGGCSTPGRTNRENRTTRTAHRSHAVGGETTLRVHNPNGAVTVTGYSGSTAEIDVKIRGPTKRSVEAVSVTSERSNGQLTVVTEYDDGEPKRASVSLTIRYPSTSPVGRLQTNNGSIEVRDVAGDPSLASRNGWLSARNIDGTVKLSTNNGEITARNVGAMGGATTSNGAIGIDVPAIPGDVDVRTTNGEIDAALALDLDATITATTSHNSVQLHGLNLDQRNDPTSATGSLGDGAHSLTFETTNGSIDLRVLSA